MRLKRCLIIDAFTFIAVHLVGLPYLATFVLSPLVSLFGYLVLPNLLLLAALYSVRYLTSCKTDPLADRMLVPEVLPGILVCVAVAAIEWSGTAMVISPLNSIVVILAALCATLYIPLNFVDAIYMGNRPDLPYAPVTVTTIITSYRLLLRFATIAFRKQPDAVILAFGKCATTSATNFVSSQPGWTTPLTKEIDWCTKASLVKSVMGFRMPLVLRRIHGALRWKKLLAVDWAYTDAAMAEASRVQRACACSMLVLDRKSEEHKIKSAIQQAADFGMLPKLDLIASDPHRYVDEILALSTQRLAETAKRAQVDYSVIVVDQGLTKQLCTELGLPGDGHGETRSNVKGEMPAEFEPYYDAIAPAFFSQAKATSRRPRRARSRVKER